MPDIYRQLDDIRTKLDRHYRDMQDIEFTIQQGKLWMLQTRSGKRTGLAALRIAVDMVRQRLISKEEALLRVEPDQLNQVLRPVFDPKKKERPLIKQAHRARPQCRAGRGVGLRWSSTPPMPRNGQAGMRRSSWCGSRLRPRTYGG